MDPTELPEEVAERIFILLTPEDLLACSLVNPSWRNIVNNNRIWKRHCNPAINLEREKSYVSPAFKVPPASESFDPICESRIRYMREVHMRRNFERGRYVEFKVPRSDYVDDEEFLGRYLFMNDWCENRFHMWDIEDEPFLVQSFPYLLRNMRTYVFRALEDSLLIVQCNLVQIYRLVDERLTLDLCILFDRDEDFSHKVPTSDDLTSWYSTNIKLFAGEFNSINETVGDYFIGLVIPDCANESVVHVWNLNSGNKLKRVAIPVVEEPVDTLCTGRNSEHVFIALYLMQSPSGIHMKMFSFNLKSLAYTNFYFESSNWISIYSVLFGNKCVLMTCDQWGNIGSYRFLDSVSGKDIVVKSVEHPMNPKTLDVNGSLIFGSGRAVTFVELERMDDVRITELEVDMDVKDVSSRYSDILLVGGRDETTSCVQVWDVKHKHRLYTVKDRSISYCGQPLPRLSFMSTDHIHILHFW